MRGFLVLGWVFSAATACCAQDWAAAMFETSVHNFGAVARGSKAEYEFVLTNKYAVDVHVANVQASCGCTTPRIEKDLLKPYEKGAIIAHLNSANYVGPRQATVTVTFDRPSYAQVQLQVAAYVHPEVLFDPDGIDLGNVDQGRRGRRQDHRLSRRPHRLDRLRGEAEQPLSRLQGRRAGPAGQPGLVRTSGAAGQKCPLRLLPGPRDPADQRQRGLANPVTVEGQVMAKVNVSPASLFLGAMQPGEKTTRQVVVWSKQPFPITSVAGDPASFQFRRQQQPAKTVHVLPVTFIAGSDRGRVVKTIHITTDRDGAAAELATYAIVTE